MEQGFRHREQWSEFPGAAWSAAARTQGRHAYRAGNLARERCTSYFRNMLIEFLIGYRSFTPAYPRGHASRDRGHCSSVRTNMGSRCIRSMLAVACTLAARCSSYATPTTDVLALG